MISACQPASSSPGMAPESKGNPAVSAAVANPLIDLTVPAAQEPQTDSKVFDESVIFSPNFAINQNDPSLSDLFSSKGVSNLCFPTALAEDLVYLAAYHSPKFSALQLHGLSGNLINPNSVVRQLTTLCRTDFNKGTDSLDAINCSLEILKQSGYDTGATQLISPFNQSATLPITSREVTIKDIREALKTGNPIILEIAWFKFDSTTNQWVHDNGHYFTVFGYDYNTSWGEDQIQVKVVNPEMNYNTARKYALFDTVTIQRYSPQPGITYPAHRPFILSGNGFSGATDRGFLGMLLTVAPANR